MGSSDFVIFGAFAAILAILLVGGTLAAAPIRRKMVALANELYNGPISSDGLRSRIDFLLDTSTSPLLVVLLIVACIATMFDRERRPETDFERDSRYKELVLLYFGSIILANPIATLLLIPVMIICGLINACANGIRGVRLADAQIDRVAHSRLARA